MNSSFCDFAFVSCFLQSSYLQLFFKKTFRDCTFLLHSLLMLLLSILFFLVSFFGSSFFLPCFPFLSLIVVCHLVSSNLKLLSSFFSVPAEFRNSSMREVVLLGSTDALRSGPGFLIFM